ncbi:hypothetical protein [Sinorhizobium sp. CCBAU 05631]|uniref:helix-turn-helix transcriptional regulator n=1 Tax=Sinorhizobium sp. CCBAU 05631 TaxID=794846 RepID=UPI001FD99391|nr:hypothetical protein [Sinorhizobium sp. CCBAU 05631]
MMKAFATGDRPRRSTVLPAALQPIGVTREQAAALLSISPPLFDSAVRAGTMPPPRVLGSRNIWSVDELREAFQALPLKWDAASELDEQQPQQGNGFDNAKTAR